MATEPSGRLGRVEQYEEHDPIRVGSDEDLRLSALGLEDDDGVRGGTGTADDPYVIARWRIPFTPREGPAIRIRGTSAHVVVERIAFEPSNAPFAGLTIWIEDAANVTIRELTVPGATGPPARNSTPPQVIDLTRVRDASLVGVSVDGNASLVFEGSRDVVVDDLTLDGWESFLWFSGGTYTVENSRVRGRPQGLPGRGGGYVNGALRLTRSDRRAGEMPCSLAVRDVQIEDVFGTGIEVDGEGCRARVSRSTITSSITGIWVRNGSRARIDAASLRRAKADVLRNEAGILVEDSGTAIVADSKTRGYRHGVRSLSSSFTVRRSSISGLRTSVHVEGSCRSCEIRNSSIGSVRNEGGGSVDARWNWWGSSSGPPERAVDGDIRVKPWLRRKPPDVEDVVKGRHAAGLSGWLAVGAGLLGASALVLRKRGGKS